MERLLVQQSQMRPNFANSVANLQMISTLMLGKYKSCVKYLSAQIFWFCSDSFYHPGCFVCSICGDVIDGEYVEDEDGRAICTKDHSDDDQICNICKMPLSDETRTISTHNLVTVGHMILHSDCFK